jgi:thioredoxin-like negative regulator of GroEL
MTARLPALCLLALLVPFACPRPGAAQVAGRAVEIQWRADYNKARQEADSKGLPLFLDFGTENCFWCKQLDVRTFRDPTLVALLNERFVPLKVDADRTPHLTQALRIQSFPTIVFATSEGKILAYQEGFLEAPALRDKLHQVLVSVGVPDWMQRDFQEAGKALTAGNCAKALSLLKNVVEDGKDRPIQARARQILEELENQAADRCARAKQLAAKGEHAKAVEAIRELARAYPGTLAVHEGKRLEATLASRSSSPALSPRARQAKDLLAQAREDYRAQQFLCCLDRCEALTTQFADLAEAKQAAQMAAEIKSNPKWTKQAADQLAERLCVLYFALADAWLKKGQPQQAIFYLDRIVKGFPSTRHAEVAQARLAQLRGAPTRTGP